MYCDTYQNCQYYYVFVGCTFFFFVVAYFYFPETRQKSLEDIAAAFGDKVGVTDDSIVIDDVARQEKMSDTECGQTENVEYIN